MARTTFDVQSTFIGDGTLATYTFDFKIEDKTQLLVVIFDASLVPVEVSRVRGDDTTVAISSVTFDPEEGGGSITLLSNLANGYRMVLLLANDSPTQPSRFRGKGSFTMKNIEMALDFVAGAVQRLAYRAKRAIVMNDIDDADAFNQMIPPGLPGTVSKIPATNAAGTGWADPSSWTPVADLKAAITAAAAAATSAAASAASAADSAAQAIAAASSVTSASAQAAAAAASAASAATDAAAAHADRLLADADKAACDADKTACDLDKAACDADKTACDADAAAAAASATAAAGSATTASTQATNASNSATAAANSATAAAASAASAAAAAAGAVPDIQGTRSGGAGPVNVVAANGIVFTSTKYFNHHFIQSSTAGQADISAVNPQIQAGTVVGARLTLQGCDDTKTVRFVHGNGVKLKNKGEVILFADDTWEGKWDGFNWVEV